MENTQNAPAKKDRKQVQTQSQWLRQAADRREARGETVTAMLFRNEAYRLEQDAR